MGVVKEIKKANEKDKALATNAWYARKVARPISLAVTKPFLWMHPNAVTLLMILVGLLAMPFLALGTYKSIIIGALILQVHYIIDHVDGNVARLTDKRSKRGLYLDYIGDVTIIPFTLIFLGMGIFRATGNISYLYYGFSSGFFLLALEPARLYRFFMFYDNKIVKKEDAQIWKTDIVAVLNKNLNDWVFNFPGIMNLILIFALFNATRYLVAFYGLTFPLLFLARAIYEFSEWKKRDLKV
jgi:hypothetical protein